MNRERENKKKSEEEYIYIRGKKQRLLSFIRAIALFIHLYTLRTCKNKIYMQ